MSSKILEYRIGELAETYAETYRLFIPDTVQESAEITNARRDNIGLRTKLFYTANYGMYTVEYDDKSGKEEEFLYFGGRDTNPIFKNIEEATEQLIRNHNYVPEKRDMQTVIASVKSGAVLKIRLSDLELKEYDLDPKFSYFEIDTAKYSRRLMLLQRLLQRKSLQRRFAERVFEQGYNFRENMKMLSDAGIPITKITVLSPKYIRDHVLKGRAIVRACRLHYFKLNSIFDVVCWDVNNKNIYLRGELAKDSAQKSKTDEPKEDYRTIVDEILGRNQ